MKVFWSMTYMYVDKVFNGCWQLCLSIVKSGPLFVKAAINPKKWTSTYKIGGKGGTAK